MANLLKARAAGLQAIKVRGSFCGTLIGPRSRCSDFRRGHRRNIFRWT